MHKQPKGPQIVLSRTDPRLLVKLFEMEVPEIYDGTVVIKNAVRAPGERAKVAVYSRERDVDPVGACVGMKGSRVQSIIRELRGEKIDIIEYSDDLVTFAQSALAPAKITRVSVTHQGEVPHLDVIVEDEQLSLAIGKRGQNVRLASELIGCRIDIKSESDVKDEVADALARMLQTAHRAAGAAAPRGELDVAAAPGRRRRDRRAAQGGRLRHASTRCSRPSAEDARRGRGHRAEDGAERLVDWARGAGGRASAAEPDIGATFRRPPRRRAVGHGRRGLHGGAQRAPSRRASSSAAQRGRRRREDEAETEARGGRRAAGRGGGRATSEPERRAARGPAQAGSDRSLEETMGKIRVQDLAQMMGISNQDLVFKLKSIGVRVEGDDAAHRHRHHPGDPAGQEAPPPAGGHPARRADAARAPARRRAGRAAGRRAAPPANPLRPAARAR